MKGNVHCPESRQLLMRSAVERGADLLMMCKEDEQEVPSPDRNEDAEGDNRVRRGVRGRTSALSAAPEEEKPVRILSLPLQPVSSGSPLRNTPKAKSAGSRLSFKLNGRLVSQLHSGAELKLRSHPGGSASGFTTASLTAPSSTPLPAPAAYPTPIITGVVSGEAAQRVLSKHSVNFTCSPLVRGPKTPRTPQPKPPSSRTPAAHQNPHSKGQLGPVSPPDCLSCSSQYKLITELRGFMCLCSPEIARSLRKLRKRKTHRRRSRDKNKTSRTFREPQTISKVSKTRPGPGLSVNKAASADFLSDQITSPGPASTTCCPQQNQSEPPADPLPGKLVIMVEDFYYGSTPQQPSTNPSTAKQKFTGPYRCIHCPKTLRNNIALMSHMQQHVSSMSLQDGHRDAQSSCPHCFRHFLSSPKLQGHLEAVHSQSKSTAKCKICELAFDTEPAFLLHMKTTHKPGEMPYVCQVCDFRSSFYSDLRSHFELLHADTKHLLCQYCLRVLHSSSCYQQHFTRHQKKHVFSCDKCRLHFLFVRERIEHKLLHHRTHIRPPQLSGLKPGTKVTVRTYSAAAESVDKEGIKQAAPCKVVDVDPPPPKQEAPKRKAVETLGPLLSTLSQESEAAGDSRPSQRCVECLSLFKDFRSHFPSLVHCSLCRFVTCCSTSYANHMINNHAICRKKPQYHSVFLSEPRLSQSLRCVSCTFTTCRGDVMANHLTEKPEHHCIMLTHSELTGFGADATSTEPTNTCSVTSSCGQGGGAFIPIHLLPSNQTSSQLSVKTLTSPSFLSSPPAMTIKFLGSHPQYEQWPGSPLSAFQLSVVLSSLCHGLYQASHRYRTPPVTIRSWIQQQERHRSEKMWCWETDKLAEWVLSQREQQLSVSEDALLQTAKVALRVDSPVECYSWVIDFLLMHRLSVEPIITDRNNYDRGRLPRNVRDNSRTFMSLLSAKFHNKAPHLVASMDEFSIFIDLENISNQNPVALHLSGSLEDRPVFTVVLSALADGTFLPPLLFFKGTPTDLPKGFPDNVLLEALPVGFTDQDCQRVWIDKVWYPRVLSQWESLLIVDVHRGHLTEEFRSSLSSMSTNVFFIPSGCCCRLQPLDVCVTPVLRNFLQARWTQLVSQGGLDGLGLDQLALTLACWLSEVSYTLNSQRDFLRRSFALVCNQQEMVDRGEAAKMIQALTEALTSEPPPDLETRLTLLLLMEQERKEDKEGEKMVQQSEKQEKTLKQDQVFNGESDQESFQGFCDD